MSAPAGPPQRNESYLGLSYQAESGPSPEAAHCSVAIDFSQLRPANYRKKRLVLTPGQGAADVALKATYQQMVHLFKACEKQNCRVFRGGWLNVLFFIPALIGWLGRYLEVRNTTKEVLSAALGDICSKAALDRLLSTDPMLARFLVRALAASPTAGLSRNAAAAVVQAWDGKQLNIGQLGQHEFDIPTLQALLIPLAQSGDSSGIKALREAVINKTLPLLQGRRQPPPAEGQVVDTPSTPPSRRPGPQPRQPVVPGPQPPPGTRVPTAPDTQLLQMPPDALFRVAQGQDEEQALVAVRGLNHLVSYGEPVQRDEAAARLLAIQQARVSPRLQKETVKTLARMAMSEALRFDKQRGAANALRKLAEGQFHTLPPEVQIEIVRALGNVAVGSPPELGMQEFAATFLCHLQQERRVQPNVLVAVAEELGKVAACSPLEVQKRASLEALLYQVDARSFLALTKESQSAILRGLFDCMTRASGEMYQLAVEKLLGLRLDQNIGQLDPEVQKEAVQALRVALTKAYYYPRGLGEVRRPADQAGDLERAMQEDMARYRGESAGGYLAQSLEATIAKELKKQIISALLSPGIAPFVAQMPKELIAIVDHVVNHFGGDEDQVWRQQTSDQVSQLLTTRLFAGDPAVKAGRDAKLAAFTVIATQLKHGSAPLQENARGLLTNLALRPGCHFLLEQISLLIESPGLSKGPREQLFEDVLIDGALALLSGIDGRAAPEIRRAAHRTLDRIERDALAPEAKKQEARQLRARLGDRPQLQPPPLREGLAGNQPAVEALARSVDTWDPAIVDSTDWLRDVDQLRALAMPTVLQGQSPAIQAAVVKALGKTSFSDSAPELGKTEEAAEALLALPEAEVMTNWAPEARIAYLKALKNASWMTAGSEETRIAAGRKLLAVMNQYLLSPLPEVQAAILSSFGNILHLNDVDTKERVADSLLRQWPALIERLPATPESAVQAMEDALHSGILASNVSEMKGRLTLNRLVPPVGTFFAAERPSSLASTLEHMMVCVLRADLSQPTRQGIADALLRLVMAGQGNIKVNTDQPAEQFATFEVLAIVARHGNPAQIEESKRLLAALAGQNNFDVCLVRIAQKIEKQRGFVGVMEVLTAGLRALPPAALASNPGLQGLLREAPPPSTPRG